MYFGACTPLLAKHMLIQEFAVEFPAKEYSHDATADILQDVNLEALCGTDVR